MGTKKGRIYGKGAPFKGAPQRFGAQLPQTAPPGSATEISLIGIKLLASGLLKIFSSSSQFPKREANDRFAPLSGTPMPFQP